MFVVKSYSKPNAQMLAQGAQTLHAANDRRYRLAYYASRQGQALITFTVDTGHANGLELHTLTANGYVLIHNARTSKHVTTLAARPAQVLRYFDALGLDTSRINKFDILLGKCLANVDNGLNNI